MAMTREAFDELVRRLEQEAARDPRGYHLKLGAFAAIGYLYVLVVLVLLVAVAGVLVAALFVSKGLVLVVKKLLIPIVVFLGLIARSLWIRLDAPAGLELQRGAQPGLFAAIDEVRALTRAPRVHHVLLQPEMNAGVVQVPRLGLFGWQRNYLLLGLPLMQLTSPDEFKAVLAHEFGHLSGAHGRFGAWIYRIRASWSQIAEALRREEHWGSFLFVPFFSWYAPRFAAWSFVKARQQEYEADRLAAEAVGTAPSASALVRIALKGDELAHSFWPGVFAAVEREPEATASPFRALAATERRGFAPDAAGKLDHALRENTSNADTHPCLRERLEALSCTAAIPVPVGQSAAEAFFGSTLDGLIEALDGSWRQDVSPWWRDRHAHLARGRGRLASLDGRALNDEELAEAAALSAELHGDEQALPRYEELLQRVPGHPIALFVTGRALLARGDETGIARVEEAMRVDPDLTLAGCGLIAGFLSERGRDAETRAVLDRYDARQQAEARAAAERETFRTTDAFLPHTVAAELVSTLCETLERNGKVKRAYLVDKRTTDGKPLHVLGFESRTPWYKPVRSGHYQGIARELARDCDLPVEISVLPLDGDNGPFRKAFRKVEGSLVFPRPSRRQ